MEFQEKMFLEIFSLVVNFKKFHVKMQKIRVLFQRLFNPIFSRSQCRSKTICPTLRFPTFSNYKVVEGEKYFKYHKVDEILLMSQLG